MLKCFIFFLRKILDNRSRKSHIKAMAENNKQQGLRIENQGQGQHPRLGRQSRESGKAERDSLNLPLSSDIPFSYGTTATGYSLDCLWLFNNRVSIACYAEPCISYGRDVRPSVCLFLCLSHAGTVSKVQNNVSYHEILPTDSPRTLVLATKSSSRNSIGFTSSEGVKFAIFSQ